jgi:hypothetical protein
MNIKFVDDIPKGYHYQILNETCCWSNLEDSVLFTFKNRDFVGEMKKREDWIIDWMFWHIHIAIIQGLIDKVLLGKDFEESKKKWIENGWTKEVSKTPLMIWYNALVMAMGMGDYKDFIFKECFEVPEKLV